MKHIKRPCAPPVPRPRTTRYNVRLSVLLGHVPGEALSPGEGWPDLHPDFHATRAHDEMEN